MERRQRFLVNPEVNLSPSFPSCLLPNRWRLPLLLGNPMKSSAGTETERIPRLPSFKNKRKALIPMADHPPPPPSSSTSACSSSVPSPFFDSSAITQMADDQFISILQFLPVESVLAFSMTCRKFRSLGCSEALWESICRRDWGKGSADALIRPLNSEIGRISWKKLYQTVTHLSSLSCTRLSSRQGAFPKPRGSHSLNFVSDYLVLYGGGCDGGRHLDDTWVAYVGGQRAAEKTVDWKKVNSGQPSGRFGHTCTVVSNSLILFGGIDDNGNRHNDTWIGQLTGVILAKIMLTWKLLDVGSVEPPARGAHASCGFGVRKIVIHGGIGREGQRLNDLWVLVLESGLNSGQWHKVRTPGPGPAARSGHSLTRAGESSMVLFGGRGAGYEALNDVWRLDMGGDGSGEWVQVDCDWSMVGPRGWPRARAGHSASVVVGGKVLIYGGEDSQRRRKNDFWLLDLKKPGKKMWKKVRVEGMGKDFRSFHAACVDRSGCRLFVFGGMVDAVSHPAGASGLRFDGGLFMVEPLLQM